MQFYTISFTHFFCIFIIFVGKANCNILLHKWKEKYEKKDAIYPYLHVGNVNF